MTLAAPAAMRTRTLVWIFCATSCGPTIDTEHGERASTSGTGGEVVLEDAEGGRIIGLRVSAASHSLACVASCEDPNELRVDESLRFVLTADQETVVTASWHDWTIGDETMLAIPDPVTQPAVMLSPDQPVPVVFNDSQRRWCADNEWFEDARFLLELNGTLVEVSGASTAYAVRDC